ncbi:Cupin superfamily protein [Saccharopolyspora shandongensis]|uniref:Cupin superfamily protein n=1 Tax=Saccharopolyspora shandongensis TaxID=418495 RepID=A0A1H3GAP4_9PSEU|nr:cupin domain-containing protein [Saccharopolyspora shandongensis]SDX99718.1 Cupin superfamily protein [Saccharopolyspora shandongensis]
MTLRFVRDLEQALAWDNAGDLGRDFARGALPDPELSTRLLTPHRLLDLLSWRSVDFPQIRALQHGADVHTRGYLTARTTRRGQSVPIVDTEKLGVLLGEGAQVVVDALNHLDAAMEVACRALQWWCGMTVQVNSYLTTGDAAGFDLHWDSHPTIIVQLAGSKRWEVRGPSRVAPLYRDTDPNTEPPEEIVWSGVLRAGEVISIPRGWWHAATRADHDDDRLSLHLTFGMAPHTGIDWISWLADLARDDERFRHDLGPNTDHTALAAALAELASENSPADYLIHQRQTDARPRRSVTGGAFGPPEKLVCTTPFAPDIVETGEAVTVIAAGRRLRFAPAATQCVRLLLSGSPVDLADAAATTGVDVHKLGAVLLEEGLCTEATPALCSAYTALD